MTTLVSVVIEGNVHADSEEIIYIADNPGAYHHAFIATVHLVSNFGPKLQDIYHKTMIFEDFSGCI
jgi:hypothetical protein